MSLDSAAFASRGPRHRKAWYRFILANCTVIDQECNSAIEALEMAESLGADGYYKL